MGRDLLRRSRVLVVCGGPVTEEMKMTSPWPSGWGSRPPPLEGILTVKGQGRRLQRALMCTLAVLARGVPRKEAV